MMSAYRSMDSHPYQINQVPSLHYYHPGFDIPPQMKVDPSKSTLAYEQPWPYASSYGCPTPVHFCCSHNNFPGYCSYRPAYPHIPTPAPMHYSGGYPAHTEPFSNPYAPLHYTMDLPRYEYDKCMPREYHCCGCPNHPFHQKEGKTVKTEEHEPDTKKVNDALVPTQMINYPYPFVWIPPEYMSNEEQEKPVAAEMDEQDKVSKDTEHPQYFRAEGQDSRSWNGWFPFDAKTLPKITLDGDGRRNQHRQDDQNRRQIEDGRTNQNHQSEDKRMEFPIPIVWVPYYNKQEEGGRTNDQESTPTPKTIEEVSRASKFVPANLCDSGTDRTSSNRDELINTSGSDVTEKVTNKKTIPVKQMDMHQREDDSEGSNKRERNIPVKQSEENIVDESSKTSVKRKSVSPKKASKLPPVCLRVDPLPRKKNGNGSSRSPSPPASKEHSQGAAGGTAKVIASSGMNDAQPDSKLHHGTNANDKVKEKEESVEVLEKISENKDDNQRDKCRSQITCNMPSGVHENSSSTTRRKESWSNGDTCMTKEKKEERKEERVIKGEEYEAREARDSTRFAEDKSQKKRKVLSDIEAAVLIQAAYRGFQVRKYELLKKLKQVDEVRNQVADVRAQIQALEASSSLHNDDRQRATIGETLMRLLLRLDTVQGLHPSFREIRKNLARELISMQEKLDSIAAKKSQQQIRKLSEMRPVEDIHPSMLSINSVQELEGEKVAAHRKDSSKGSNGESHDTQEPCQDQHSMKDSISGFKTENQGFVAHSLPDDDNRECWSQICPVSNKEIKPNPALNDTVNEDTGQAATNDMCNLENPLYDNDQAVRENETISEGKCAPTEVYDLDMRAWKELPQGVIEEEPVLFESGKEVETDMCRLPQSEIANTMAENNSLVMVDYLVPDGKFPEIEAMLELPVGILDDSAEDTKHSAIEAIAELPVGILDEDITTSQSEFEKSEATEPSTQEILQAVGEGLADDISSEIQIERQQQQLEKQGKERSSEESDGWGKVVSLKDDKLNGEPSLDIEVKSGEKVISGSVQFSDIAELQSVPSFSGTPVEANDFYDIQSQPVDCRMDPKTDAPINVVEMDKSLAEEVSLQDQQLVDEHAIDANAETSAKEKEEVTLPVSEEPLLAEHNKGVDGDKQLIEENKKLREMMKKLLEAGNEQLNVISDLTGRVKDLEKKLARKKRLRTKRYRPATSCMKSSNDLTQAKSVRVAV